jgi:tetratricopeptide (TPR) repeat protein
MYAGQCNQMLGQYEEALAHYKIGISYNTESAEIYFHRGLAYVSLTQFHEGINDFKKAHDLSKSSGDKDNSKYRILLNLGINLRRVGDAKQSIEYLGQAIQAQQNKPQAHNNLGLSQYEMQNWDEAITSYENAIRLEKSQVGDVTPGSGPPKEYLSLYYNNKGLALYHRGGEDDAKEAIADYQKAIDAIGGTNAENFFNRGNVYLSNSEFEKAHADFDTAI